MEVRSTRRRWIGSFTLDAKGTAATPAGRRYRTAQSRAALAFLPLQIKPRRACKLAKSPLPVSITGACQCNRHFIGFTSPAASWIVDVSSGNPKHQGGTCLAPRAPTEHLARRPSSRYNLPMTEKLPFKTEMAFAYGEAAEMVPGVQRLVANNPGPFTFKGTNTYLVGQKTLTVIDPGPVDGAHLAAILEAANGRPIATIVITHTHKDHVEGLAALRAATGAKSAGFGRAAALMSGGDHPTPTGAEFVFPDFAPDIVIRHGDRIEGIDHALVALHTPGHAPDHLCFALEGFPAAALFSGDHVMAWNTSVVAPPEGHMAAYLASLELLIGRPETVYLPGHGGRLADPQRMVRAFLLHRRWREQAILAAIRSGRDGSPAAVGTSTTIRQIVPVVYPELDAHLLTAATLSVQAHVEHLMERGLVSMTDPGPSSGPWDRALTAV